MGGRGRKLIAKKGGKACVQRGGFRRAVRVKKINSHPNNTMQNKN